MWQRENGHYEYYQITKIVKHSLNHHSIIRQLKTTVFSFKIIIKMTVSYLLRNNKPLQSYWHVPVRIELMAEMHLILIEDTGLVFLSLDMSLFKSF